MPMMRVARSTFETVQPPKVDQYERCLEIWAESMRYNDRDAGVQLMRLPTGKGDGYGEDVDCSSHSSYDRADRDIAEAVGAMIDSLKVCQQWAIRRQMGVCTVWRYPSLDYAEVAQEAEKYLRVLLQRNLATAALFR